MVQLVIVVTGANSGVGFGICHRLLVQLSSTKPPDAQPYFNTRSDPAGATVADEYAFSADAGLTIILACRNSIRAEEAKARLFYLLDERISKLAKGSHEHEYASTFRAKVRLLVEPLDLASIKSVLDFGQRVSKQFEYISHLILNAGTATYSHLDTRRFFLDLVRYPLSATVNTRANIQVNGVMSDDGLGYTFQCNVFGHYVLYRAVQPLLVAFARASKTSARVMWIGSMVAAPMFDPDSDWQLTKTFHSYEGSKFQEELLSAELDKRALAAQNENTETSLSGVVGSHGEIRHLIASPGIVQTGMAQMLSKSPPWQANTVMTLIRFLGCSHVLTNVYAAAVAPVHLALVPLRSLPTPQSSPDIRPSDISYPPWHKYHGNATTRVQVFRFGSENDRWGYERTGIVAVPVWEEHPDFGTMLLDRFEKLYQTFVTAKGPAQSSI